MMVSLLHSYDDVVLVLCVILFELLSCSGETSSHFHALGEREHGQSPDGWN
jgi:hypothetical protein